MLVNFFGTNILKSRQKGAKEPKQALPSKAWTWFGSVPGSAAVGGHVGIYRWDRPQVQSFGQYNYRKLLGSPALPLLARLFEANGRLSVV